MKKILLMAIVGVLAHASNAAYLYWQVSSDDLLGASDATSWYTTDGGSVNAARIYDARGTKQSTILLNGADIGDTAGVPTSTPYAIDIGTVTDGASYSYYVELGNYASSTFTAVARSATETIQYNASGSTPITTTLQDVARVAPWHAGYYRAVPEPTSAILMLFGAAMLGLKRKNRSQC